jgi:hypothetical protein
MKPQIWITMLLVKALLIDPAASTFAYKNEWDCINKVLFNHEVMKKLYDLDESECQDELPDPIVLFAGLNVITDDYDSNSGMDDAYSFRDAPGSIEDYNPNDIENDAKSWVRNPYIDERNNGILDLIEINYDFEIKASDAHIQSSLLFDDSDVSEQIAESSEQPDESTTPTPSDSENSKDKSRRLKLDQGLGLNDKTVIIDETIGDDEFGLIDDGESQDQIPQSEIAKIVKSALNGSSGEESATYRTFNGETVSIDVLRNRQMDIDHQGLPTGKLVTDFDDIENGSVQFVDHSTSPQMIVTEEEDPSIESPRIRMDIIKKVVSSMTVENDTDCEKTLPANKISPSLENNLPDQSKGKDTEIKEIINNLKSDEPSNPKDNELDQDQSVQKQPVVVQESPHIEKTIHQFSPIENSAIDEKKRKESVVENDQAKEKSLYNNDSIKNPEKVIDEITAVKLAEKSPDESKQEQDKIHVEDNESPKELAERESEQSSVKITDENSDTSNDHSQSNFDHEPDDEDHNTISTETSKPETYEVLPMTKEITTTPKDSIDSTKKLTNKPELSSKQNEDTGETISSKNITADFSQQNNLGGIEQVSQGLSSTKKMIKPRDENSPEVKPIVDQDDSIETKQTPKSPLDSTEDAKNIEGITPATENSDDNGHNSLAISRTDLLDMSEISKENVPLSIKKTIQKEVPTADPSNESTTGSPSTAIDKLNTEPLNKPLSSDDSEKTNDHKDSEVPKLETNSPKQMVPLDEDSQNSAPNDIVEAKEILNSSEDTNLPEEKSASEPKQSEQLTEPTNNDSSEDSLSKSDNQTQLSPETIPNENPTTDIQNSKPKESEEGVPKETEANSSDKPNDELNESAATDDYEAKIFEEKEKKETEKANAETKHVKAMLAKSVNDNMMVDESSQETLQDSNENTEEDEPKDSNEENSDPSENPDELDKEKPSDKADDPNLDIASILNDTVKQSAFKEVFKAIIEKNKNEGIEDDTELQVKEEKIKKPKFENNAMLNNLFDPSEVNYDPQKFIIRPHPIIQMTRFVQNNNKLGDRATYYAREDIKSRIMQAKRAASKGDVLRQLFDSFPLLPKCVQKALYWCGPNFNNLKRDCENNKKGTSCRINEFYALLTCDENETLINQTCYKSCPKGFVDFKAFCLKPSYVRRATKEYRGEKLKQGEEFWGDSLIVEQCSNYGEYMEAAGPDYCRARCPTGFPDRGIYCQKPYRFLRQPPTYFDQINSNKSFYDYDNQISPN